VLAGGGIVLAAAAAVADGALLREPAGPEGERPVSAPPAPVVPRGWPLREDSHRALAAMRLLGHLLAGIGLAWLLLPSGASGWPRLFVLGAVGLLTVVAAETGARAVGDAMGERVVARFDAFIRFAERLASPVLALGRWIDGLLAVAVSEADATADRREEAAQQFREVLSADVDVSRDERELLLGVFEFGETTAAEVMVPRVDVLGIERDTPWSEMLDRVGKIQHSRVPVYTDTLDEIVGILYVKDLLPSVLADEEPGAGWQTLLRPAVFIPGAKRIADLLREFRQDGRHMAIVADEYGGTAGLVTIEDVLEELVGEIRDEYDVEERQVEEEAGERFWVSGRLTLDDLSAAVGHDCSREGVTSVGGLILDELGRVPRAGESLRLGPFRVVVERVIRRKIERVYLERVAPGDDASPGEAL
jgi:CBS domain containing-hemolysin-like protein